MPAKSETQQRLMGMVHAYNKGKLDMSNMAPTLAKEIKRLSKTMKKKDVKKFAKTKHKGIPEKVKENEAMTFKTFLFTEAVTPTKPRSGHYVRPWKRDEFQRIDTVSKGYAYVDTGTSRRDAIHLSNLKYDGMHGNKHTWLEV